MNTDLYSYTARTRAHPKRCPAHTSPTVEQVVVAGYHSAFAVAPSPATVVAPFPELDLIAVQAARIPMMALVRLEDATQIIIPGPGTTSRINWETATDEVSWYLAPALLLSDRRLVIAPGRWSAGGRQAVLPLSVTASAPRVPTVVDIHDHDPRTGNRWPTT